jgi:hypothetical protein
LQINCLVFPYFFSSPLNSQESIAPRQQQWAFSLQILHSWQTCFRCWTISARLVKTLCKYFLPNTSTVFVL